MSHPAAEHSAKPSAWPAALALGLTLLVFGVVTSIAFSIVGALVLLTATAGWIGELRRDE